MHVKYLVCAWHKVSAQYTPLVSQRTLVESVLWLVTIVKIGLEDKS